MDTADIHDLATPWTRFYPPGMPHRLTPVYNDGLSLFRAAVARMPAAPALFYFDGRMSFAELDRRSDELAALIADRGFVPGDRLALYLQNVPFFVIGLLAAWKTGGIAVPISPMNREREVALLLDDCTPRALIHEDGLQPIVEAAIAGGAHDPAIRYATSPLTGQGRDDARVLGAGDRADPLVAALAGYAGRSPAVRRVAAPEDLAFIVYTSGTTGKPKGVMLSHANVAYNAFFYREWVGLSDGRTMIATAPLFHITGLVKQILACFAAGQALVLTYRFEPGVVLEAVAEHGPQMFGGAITALVALMTHPAATRAQFDRVEAVYSGGAPISPALAARFRDTFGLYIHNVYGLTETASPTHAVPPGADAPIDPTSGALSVGVPIPGATAHIADDYGRSVPPGTLGEIVSTGPMIARGYWNKPVETAESMTATGFRTGDIGFMDADGWFYVVDRKKDMINASGYKVWPREVEDVLCSHPDVNEAAVIGIPDEYRGETVKAFVALRGGATTTADELYDFAKARLAAYKYPRQIELVAALPKTASGKILRREMRAQAVPPQVVA